MSVRKYFNYIQLFKTSSFL